MLDHPCLIRFNMTHEQIVYPLSKDRDIVSPAGRRSVRIHATSDTKIVLCKGVLKNNKYAIKKHVRKYRRGALKKLHPYS